MREELLYEQEHTPDHRPAPVSAPTAPMALTSTTGPTTNYTAPTASDGERWVTPNEMKSLFPDLF